MHLFASSKSYIWGLFLRITTIQISNAKLPLDAQVDTSNGKDETGD